MIQISGTVIGELVNISCAPTRFRFVTPEGEQVVSEPVFADIFVDQGKSVVQLELASTDELTAPDEWQWEILETDRQLKRTRFFIPSEPANYNYADIRPVGGP